MIERPLSQSKEKNAMKFSQMKLSKKESRKFFSDFFSALGWSKPQIYLGSQILGVQSQNTIPSYFIRIALENKVSFYPSFFSNLGSPEKNHFFPRFFPLLSQQSHSQTSSCKKPKISRFHLKI